MAERGTGLFNTAKGLFAIAGGLALLGAGLCATAGGGDPLGGRTLAGFFVLLLAAFAGYVALGFLLLAWWRRPAAPGVQAVGRALCGVGGAGTLACAGVLFLAVSSNASTFMTGTFLAVAAAAPAVGLVGALLKGMGPDA